MAREDEVSQARIKRLIDRSSLGTPAAKALRSTVSDEAVARVMARVAELEAEDEQ